MECNGGEITHFVLSIGGVSLVLLATTLVNISNNKSGIKDAYLTSDVTKVSGD